MCALDSIAVFIPDGRIGTLMLVAFSQWHLTQVCNLVLAARATHAWYRLHFGAYPPSRKALVPLLW